MAKIDLSDPEAVQQAFDAVVRGRGFDLDRPHDNLIQRMARIYVIRPEGGGLLVHAFPLDSTFGRDLPLVLTSLETEEDRLVMTDQTGRRFIMLPWPDSLEQRTLTAGKSYPFTREQLLGEDA